MRNDCNLTSKRARPRKRPEFFAATTDPVNGVPLGTTTLLPTTMGSSSTAANLVPGRVNLVSNVCPSRTRTRVPAGITTAGFAACSAAGDTWAGLATNGEDASVAARGAESSTGSAETTGEILLPVVSKFTGSTAAGASVAAERGAVP